MRPSGSWTPTEDPLAPLALHAGGAFGYPCFIMPRGAARALEKKKLSSIP
jgi:hypothetical protein